MENKNQQFKGYGKIEQAHSQVLLKDLELTFIFDSKENIYSFKYISRNLDICRHLSNNYDLYVGLGCSHRDSLFKLNFRDSLDIYTLAYIQRAFILGFQNYLGDPGSLLQQDSSIDEDILCYCAKVSRRSFEKTYNKVRGNKKEAIFETLVKSFCDTCNNNVDSFIAQLELKSDFFMNKDKKDWIKRIDELIEEFYLFCPPEYNKLKFEVTSLKFDKIIIKCDNSNSSLKRGEIQKTLSNYLLGEIEDNIVISIIT